MKKLDKLFSPVIRNVLCACMAFAWTISTKHISFLFFGEYEYPEDK